MFLSLNTDTRKTRRKRLTGSRKFEGISRSLEPVHRPGPGAQPNSPNRLCKAPGAVPWLIHTSPFREDLPRAWARQSLPGSDTRMRRRDLKTEAPEAVFGSASGCLLPIQD